LRVLEGDLDRRSSLNLPAAEEWPLWRRQLVVDCWHQECQRTKTSYLRYVISYPRCIRSRQFIYKKFPGVSYTANPTSCSLFRRHCKHLKHCFFNLDDT
jgi:hypothetical protein